MLLLHFGYMSLSLHLHKCKYILKQLFKNSGADNYTWLSQFNFCGFNPKRFLPTLNLGTNLLITILYDFIKLFITIKLNFNGKLVMCINSFFFLVKNINRLNFVDKSMYDRYLNTEISIVLYFFFLAFEGLTLNFYYWISVSLICPFQNYCF